MDIITLALAKKFAKEYTDTHASKITEEDAIQAVANYFNENPNAIVTKNELEIILDNIPAGNDGKSAYEYAQEGGFIGTEEEFSQKLAAELQLDDTLKDNTKAAPAGLVGELKSDLANKVPKTDYAPEEKIDAMTQPVGKDENGKLWTTVPDKVSASENDAGYLTEHQDISGKAEQTDVDSLASNQSVLSARMDTFTKLGEGSTTGDAELQDIRVGSDGKIYNTAGEAVREQVGELKGDIVELNNIGTINIYDVGVQKDGYFVNYNNENYVKGGRINHEKYEILIIPNNKNYSKLIVGTYQKGTSVCAVAFYTDDATKPSNYMNNESIQAKEGFRNYIVNIPDDCKYIVITNRKELGSASGTLIENYNENILNNFIISEILDSDLFTEKHKIPRCLSSSDSKFVDSSSNSSTHFINLEKVKHISFENLYDADFHKGFEPIHFFDENFHWICSANPVYTKRSPSSGYLDMSDYQNAKYAIFSNYNNDTEPKITFYVDKLNDAKYRNKVYVGAYYFAGWSELDFPNIHVTDSIINEHHYRKPVWGWIEHGCYKGEGWLITPSITLGENSEMTLINSCIFHKEGQCGIFVRENGSNWININASLPDANKTTMSNTIINLSAFDGKNIQIGFMLKNHINELSAIWIINKISVSSNSSVVYEKDYTNHDNFDCMITDDDVWKPATPTLGYSGVNGYVGTTYNQGDYSIIDKQINLAKNNGIDYFILDWYYHDNKGDFNQEAIENEDNHIAVKAFIKSVQKYNFNFVIMISNNSGFEITSLERWKSAINYLNDTYFKDPSYLIIDNKPVVNIFSYNGIKDYLSDIEEYFKELGYDGVIWQLGGYNTAYNSIPSNNGNVERDLSDLIKNNKTNNKYYWERTRPIYFPYLTCGWDSRPWWNRPNGYARVTDWYTRDTEKWKEFFNWGYLFAKYRTAGSFKSVVICAFNEYGEGSYLTPTEGDKRASYLLAIKEIINKYQN